MSSTTAQRQTRQKLAINEALRIDDTFRSAQEIHQALTGAGDKIGLATVYRNLQALADDGLVDMVRSPEGEAMYRACQQDHHHHHLVCTSCGKTTEFSVAELEGTLNQIGAQSGYTQITHSIDLFGLCANCSQQAAHRD